MRLTTLPAIEPLRKLSQSLAMLDAIMSPEWEFRYFSFNSQWRLGEMMASMRNGSGDDYFLLFTHSGAIMKGFWHESPMSPYAQEPKQLCSGIFDEVPECFKGFLSEPAFRIEDTTFCLWRQNGDQQWRTGNIEYPEESDPDGSEYLLAMLKNDPVMYLEFAEEYYEKKIPLSVVRQIYEHQPLTDEMVISLNSEALLGDLEAEINEIGYPKA